MAIVFNLESDGGFLAGDTETGFTSYAYPTSTHADFAKRQPGAQAKIAAEMMEVEIATPYRVEYDARNWLRLERAGVK